MYKHKASLGAPHPHAVLRWNICRTTGCIDTFKCLCGVPHHSRRAAAVSRNSGCIDALARVTRASLEASERDPNERRAAEAAADAHTALAALWRLLAKPGDATGSADGSPT